MEENKKPLMHHSGEWPREVSAEKRKNTIFAAFPRSGAGVKLPISITTGQVGPACKLCIKSKGTEWLGNSPACLFHSSGAQLKLMCGFVFCSCQVHNPSSQVPGPLHTLWSSVWFLKLYLQDWTAGSALCLNRYSLRTAPQPNCMDLHAQPTLS